MAFLPQYKWHLSFSAVYLSYPGYFTFSCHPARCHLSPGRHSSPLAEIDSPHSLNGKTALFRILLLTHTKHILLLLQSKKQAAFPPLRPITLFRFQKSCFFKVLKKAGCTAPVFDDAAIEAILNASDGTARVISKLCNASLVTGHSQSTGSQLTS